MSRGSRGRWLYLAAAAGAVALLLAGFSALWLFRTVPLTTDPVTWIEIYSVRLGSGFHSGEQYGRPVTEVLYKFNRELLVEARPSSVPATTCDASGAFCSGSISFTPTAWSVSPVRRETVDVLADVGYGSTYAQVSLYSFMADLDRSDAGLPDLGAIVMYVGRQGNTYQYVVETVVSGAPPGTQSYQTGEHRSRWLDTFIVFRVDPWSRVMRVRVDGREIVPPGEACLARGDCKFVLGIASEAPNTPIASGYTLLERLHPYTSGHKSIVKIHLVELDVDPNVVAGTAQTTIYGEVTAPGVTTVVIPATKTVVITQRQTVTATMTLSTYKIIYATTTHRITVIGGTTYTVPAATTVVRTVTAPHTVIAEAPTRTVTTTVIQPGERLTITQTITTAAEQPILPPITRDTLAMLLGAAVVLALLLTIIIVAAAVARGRGAPRGPYRRPPRRSSWGRRR